MARKNRIKKKMDAFTIIVYSMIILYVLSMVYLLSFGFLNSLKHQFDFKSNKFGLPSAEYGWQFSNYAELFEKFIVPIKPVGQVGRDVYIEEMFLNTILYAGLMSVFTIATQVMVAYIVAKHNFVLNKLIYTVAIVVMLIPIVGSLPSQIRFAQQLGLNNSILGICIMNCNYPGIYFLVFYAAFKSVPFTYSEAAQLDGASYFKIFLNIMLPMIGSAVAAVFVLYFIRFWNEYQLPMIFLPDYPTISYGLYFFDNSSDVFITTPLRLGAAFMSCIPVIILFVMFSKKIMGNVAVGGLKG